MKQVSFGEIELQSRLSKDSTLNKINRLLNWDKIKLTLSGLYRCESKDRGGKRPYDSLNMFKAILLGQWHSLSDPELQEALQIRLDFIAFCGFPLDELPDDTTLCRFRNRLIATNKLPPLLNEINRQLQSHGLMMQKTKGAIVDATLITSAARPRTEMIVQTDDSGAPVSFEDGSQPSVEVIETHSADPDATWVKKGKKSHFGYRVYDVVDDEGYLLGSHTAPANQSEMNHFIPALEAAYIHAGNAERVLTDKGSASQAHRDYLKSKQLKCGIMHKAVRNKPLRQHQKRANKLISKTRYRVEQFFGTLKRTFDFRRASYIGTVKVNAQMLLKGMCANLLKAANKIQIDWDIAGISPSKKTKMA